MSTYQPKFVPGDTYTHQVTADVKAGRLVNVAGTHAAADDKTAIGVASRDAKAGESVMLYDLGGVQRLTAAGAIAKGAAVKTAAAGKVATGDDTGSKVNVGIALEAATLDGDVIAVKC